MMKALLCSVLTLAVTTLCAIAIPYTQNFTELSFPAGWTQTYSGGLESDSWSVSGSDIAGGTPNEILASYQFALGTSRLISPPLETQGLTALSLSFIHYYDDYGAGVSAKIQFSHNLNQWFDAPWSVTGGHGDESGTVNIFIPGIGNGSVTYLAWVIEGDHYQFDYWYVDNVSITLPPEHEVAAISIDIPVVVNSEAMLPQVTIGNNGLNSETFTATIEIGSYSNTQTIVNMPPGTNQQVLFDSVTPEAYNTYSAVLTVSLAEDEFPGNNTISGELICLPLDVQGYADCVYDPSSVNSGPCTFNLKNPGSVVDLASPNPFSTFLSGADWINGGWYGTEFNLAGSPFWRVSEESGAATLQGTGSIGMNGIAYDEKNNIIYATNGYNLYTLSFNGAATYIGSLRLPGDTSWYGNMIGIAYDSFARVLYGIDIDYDWLFTINTTNGICTIKPNSLGVDLDYTQDCAFDRDHGLLYMAGFTDTGNLYWIDTETGKAHLIGPFQGGAELVGFAIPYHDLPATQLEISDDGTLSWTAVPQAARYHIYSSYAPSGDYVYEASTAELSWNIPDYSENRKFYVVTATNVPSPTSLNRSALRNLPGKTFVKRAS